MTSVPSEADVGITVLVQAPTPASALIGADVNNLQLKQRGMPHILMVIC